MGQRSVAKSEKDKPIFILPPAGALGTGNSVAVGNWIAVGGWVTTVDWSAGGRVAAGGWVARVDTDCVACGLSKNGFEIKAYDPVASDNVKKLLGDKIKLVKHPYSAIEKADSLVIITEWNEFKQIDLAKVKKLLRHPVIFDGRNIYKPESMKKMGFKYFSIGRPSWIY